MTCETLGLNRKVSLKGNFLIQNGLDGPHLITFWRPTYGTVVVEVNIYGGTRSEVVVVMARH